ncbi:MAG: TolB family protein, partial [Phycisphaerales bacterium JB041]
MHAEAQARHARTTPAALLLLSAGLTAAVLSGCHSHSTTVESAPRPAAETEVPEPVAAELSLFGDDEIAWSSPDRLPADPIPLTASPDSADVSRVTTAEQGADFDPTISADGRYMVFASTQHNLNADIYIKRTGSKVITQLTNDPGRDVMPSISPDGAWIAFASDRVSNWNIYVMPVTGGRPVQITSSPNAELHPSWSPDGTRLAFSKLGSTSGKWEIWVTEVSNTATPHFIGYGLFPEWCPKPGTGPTGGDLLLYQRSAERGDRAFGIWTLEYKDGDVGSPSQMAGSAT